MKAHSVLPVAMATAVAALALPLPTLAAVGVAITLGEPNFYGRIDLGRMAPPPIIRDYPVQVRRGPRGILLEPLSVRVTEREQRNWRRYCGRDDVCSRPVYFVRDPGLAVLVQRRSATPSPLSHSDEGELRT